MKKIGLLSALFIFSLSFSIAQPAAQDPKAKSILDGVSAKIKTYTSMQVEFSQSMVNTKDKINENQQGKIQLKGDKYHLTLASQTVISDGKTTWTYLKDVNEVNVDNASKDEEAINPTSIFTIWEKGFKYKYIKEEIQNGVPVHIIDLTPIKGKSFFKVRLIIDKNKQQLTSASIHEKNGTIYTYKIIKFTPNISINESIFTFNKASYPGVQVIDMR
ncbi:MAG: outer membrane lipoprotein carrier protein LolA [Bacteroidota bacterium]